MALFILSLIMLSPMIVNQATSQSWSAMPSSPGQSKEISCRIHDDIWDLRTDGTIFHWENNAWKQMPGGANRISASFETKHPWITGLDNTPFRFDGTNWNQVSNILTFKQISARDYNTAIAVGMDGSVQRYDEGKGWSTVSTASTLVAKHCSIGKDGGTIWCIDTNRAIWRRTFGDTTYTQMVGIADVVDTYDYNRVVVTNTQTQQIFAFMVGNRHWNNQIATLSGGLLQASISDTYLYGTAADFSVWWAPYPTQSF